MGYGKTEEVGKKGFWGEKTISLGIVTVCYSVYSFIFFFSRTNVYYWTKSLDR